MRAWLERVWYQPSAPPLALQALSPLYEAVAARIAERKRRRAQRLPVPVIVVGNITVGGTGKTPCVLWLAQRLTREGRRPGILSRGYGGRGPFPRRVLPGEDPARCGDEPALLAMRAGVPIVVAPDRVAAAHWLLREHPEVDVLLCDDGLQHYRLARDLEICVIDGARGLGNARLLPAGPLREPPQRLETVDLVLVNGAPAEAFGARALRFDLRIEHAVNLRTGEQRPLASFAAQEVAAIAGIGHPDRFFAALQSQGLRVQARAFPDHHEYAAAELRFAGDGPLLMTEKDAVKCLAFARSNWWAVPAQLTLAPAAEARLMHLLGERQLLG